MSDPIALAERFLAVTKGLEERTEEAISLFEAFAVAHVQAYGMLVDTLADTGSINREMLATRLAMNMERSVDKHQDERLARAFGQFLYVVRGHGAKTN